MLTEMCNESLQECLKSGVSIISQKGWFLAMLVLRMTSTVWPLRVGVGSPSQALTKLGLGDERYCLLCTKTVPTLRLVPHPNLLLYCSPRHMKGAERPGPHLQMRKAGLNKVREYAPGHMAGKRKSLDLNAGLDDTLPVTGADEE